MAKTGAKTLLYEIIGGWKVNARERYALGIEPTTKQYSLSFPVDNGLVEYEEYYVVPQAWVDDPDAHDGDIHEMLAKARARELDEALIIKPGSKRGWP